jgi:hypothetical protein
MKFVPLLAIVAAWCTANSACSTQAWYEGGKVYAENECRRQRSGDTDACLARVNRMSYDEYERKRSGQRP